MEDFKGTHLYVQRNMMENFSISVSQCEPTVDQLDEHIEELNISNDFAKFIIKMRKAFRRNLMKENDQNFSVNIM